MGNIGKSPMTYSLKFSIFRIARGDTDAPPCSLLPNLLADIMKPGTSRPETKEFLV
jgi:hypothetical protein